MHENFSTLNLHVAIYAVSLLFTYNWYNNDSITAMLQLSADFFSVNLHAWCASNITVTPHNDKDFLQSVLGI